MNVVTMLKECGPGDSRVLLLPEKVRGLVSHGFVINVQTGAGEGLGIADSQYQISGARIVSEEEALDGRMLISLKAPSESKLKNLTNGAIIASIFHAEGAPEIIEVLLDKKITAFALEFFKNDDGQHPLGAAGGTVAGVQAAMYGLYHLQSHFGGKGVLAIPTTYTTAGKAVIIGSGNVGLAAARTLFRLGLDVTVLCSSERSRSQCRRQLDDQVNCLVNHRTVLEKLLTSVDIVIGAILISTYDTPPMITRGMVKSMQKGAVIVDATAGYGPGYFETFTKITSLDAPFFIEEDVIHIKIDNFPAAVPVSSVEAVNNVYPYYILNFLKSLRDGNEDRVSMMAKITDNGEICHPEILRHYQLWLQKSAIP